MNHPKVSIIILNWNGLEDTIKCLESLKKITYPNYEVIIVDNGSEGNDSQVLKEKFGDYIRLVENDRNYGFAEGNNIGIKEAFNDEDVKYIATLNNDTIVEQHWLEELVRAADMNGKIGSYASKMRYYHKPNIINAAGDLVLKDGSGVNRGRNERDIGQHDEFEEVFGACAGAALYRRKMLEEIGLFDSDYFAYNEDLDLAWRARLAGWKCRYVPSAIVYHVHSATVGSFSTFKIYYGERNRIWTLLKNYPLNYILLSAPYTVAKLSLLAFAAFRGKGRGLDYTKNIPFKNLVLTLLKAWVATIWSLPRLLKKRKKIQTLKKVSREEIDLWLKRFSVKLPDIPYK